MIRKPLAVTTRSGRIDALHYGSVVLADPRGTILYSFNDPDFPTYLRSSIKMIQALPVVLSGAAERFGFTDAELAICCASHSGSDMHLKTVSGILAKIGCTQSDLGCGAHIPDDLPERRHLICSDLAPTQLHNNCSGKHAGMLASCVASGWPVEDYLSIEHPLQQWILDLMSEYSGVARENIGIGVDGCSLPACYMPISGAARLIARFMEKSQDPATPDAAILKAIAARPEMIHAPGAFDTELVRVTGGRLLAKGGAMAMFLIGVQSPQHGPIGLAVKLEDGNMTPMPVVVMNVLVSLGLLNEDEIAQLENFRRIDLRNWRGLDVGEIGADFEVGTAVGAG